MRKSEENYWVSRGRIWVECQDGKKRKRKRAKICDITEGNLAIIISQYGASYLCGNMQGIEKKRFENVVREYTRKNAVRRKELKIWRK